MRTFFYHTVSAFFITYLLFHVVGVALPYTALSTSLVFSMFFGVLWATSWIYNRAYFRKLPKAISLTLYFLKELIIANVKIAYDIVTPHYYMRPTVIALPLKVRTNLEITLLACMITLTPGTLSIDVSEDRKTLYVHALYVKQNDVMRLKKHLKDGFERRLIELTS